MAYNDPYYNNANTNQQFHQQYTDTPDFDPYNTHQPHPSYDQGGYMDEAEAFPGAGASGVTKEHNAYQAPGLDAPFTPPRTTNAVREWRRDHHGNFWTKGGRGRCIGRFCCCTLLITLFLIISIVLTLAVWIRPPNISIGSVSVPTNGSTFQVTSDSLNLNLGVNISVDNPNYFSVDFKRIKADLTYPINNTDVGGGELDNVDFHSHSSTTFTFPFTVTYNEADDPSRAVLTDLLTKCGIIGGTESNIVVKYQITLGVKILFVTISPSFSNNFSFACPINAEDISSLLQGSGLNISGITRS